MAKLDRVDNRSEITPENTTGSFWGDWLNGHATERTSENEEHNIWTRAIHAALLATEASK